MAQEISLEALARARGEQQNTEPEPAVIGESASIETLTPEQLARVEEIKNSIDLMDSQATLQYGVGAQRNISGFADNILSQVRSKDSGYVGELMSDLVVKVKDVGVDKLNEDSFTDKIPFLKTASRSLKKFVQRYEDLEVQIGRIEGELDKARMQMLKDVAMFDGLYEKNLEYFQELQIYIAAGEEKLKELREETLPNLRRQAQEKGDPMSAQLVSDFEDTVNRFEKKSSRLKAEQNHRHPDGTPDPADPEQRQGAHRQDSDGDFEHHSPLEEPDCHRPGTAQPGEDPENPAGGDGHHQPPAGEKL